jgi:WD40 repeat protein
MVGLCATALFLFTGACSRAKGIEWTQVAAPVTPLVMINKIVGSTFTLADLCHDNLVPVPALSAAPPKISYFGDIDTKLPVTAIAWSPDGRYIATSENRNQLIKIWNFPALTLLHTIQGQGNSIADEWMFFTKDSRDLVVTSLRPVNLWDRTSISVVDVTSGLDIHDVAGEYDPSDYPRKGDPRWPMADIPSRAVLSFDGNEIYAVNGDSNDHIMVFDTKKWMLESYVPVPNFVIQAANDHFILSIRPPFFSGMTNVGKVSNDIFYVWSTHNNQMSFQSDMMSESFIPQTLSVSNDGCEVVTGAFVDQNAIKSSTISTGSNDTKVQYTQPENPPDAIKVFYPKSSQLRNLQDFPEIFATEINPVDDDLIAVADSSPSIVLFDTNTSSDQGAFRAVVHVFHDEATDVNFSPDGRYIAGAGDKAVMIYMIGER